MYLQATLERARRARASLGRQLAAARRAHGRRRARRPRRRGRRFAARLGSLVCLGGARPRLCARWARARPREVVSQGPASLRGRCCRLRGDSSRSSERRAAGLPAGAGPVWTGGFAFAEGGGAEAHWSSLPPALMVLPELSLLRESDRTFAHGFCRASPRRRCRRAPCGRSAGVCRPSPRPRCPCSTPRRQDAYGSQAPQEPSAYERAVATAVGRIPVASSTKVVLAREVSADAPRAHDPAALFGALRELFPSCYCFCVGHARGRVHRRQPGASGATSRGGCADGCAGGLDPP